MARTLNVNETTVHCHDCERELAPAEGLQLDYWARDTFICTPCREARARAVDERQQREIRQGSILNSLIPAIGKLGNIDRIRTGRDEYTSTVDVQVSGKTFLVSVQEKDSEG
jgi:hypothetical protein